ncbi:uncharacterized protein LOC124893777, partial [Capsicum annuum]|uniref:uncharacterized protein LOC124893777 n=1 Tax=Capsicum annuum TaxID=4072 RepID=UPI001FB0F9C5
MRIFLQGKKKFGFITGAYSKDNYREKLHKQWETCNAIVLSWLMISISAEFLSGILYATRAFKVWEDLNERFDKVKHMRLYQLHKEITRRQILLKGVTPTLNQAYAMIIEDEMQQLTYAVSTNEKIDPMAMQVNRGPNKSLGSQSYRGPNMNLEVKVIEKKYDYCNHASTNNEENKEINNVVLAEGHGFTDEEYKQIMETLNKDPQDAKQANMSGIATFLPSHIVSQEWIDDSSATHHIVVNKELLSTSKIVRSTMDKVNLPNDAEVDISHAGEAVVSRNAAVKDVLFVPDFKLNLLSVSKDLYTGRVKWIGRERGGLYILKDESGTNGSSVDKTKLIARLTVKDTILWNKRLGHPSVQVLKFLDLLNHNKDIE